MQPTDPANLHQEISSAEDGLLALQRVEHSLSELLFQFQAGDRTAAARFLAETISQNRIALTALERLLAEANDSI